ncbi:hypothetical protein BU26DRAFT_607517 [Trematosphaeria pertusa]|uniref:Uncharacterized protein n=1 Tax=Trematosphaeria pertusa TaxID=390896 RepID=A0A6A6I9U9_9PLEO|nr:uncharacterized protein BU26DRAFT_607517 [Trematosphaeria pertusa]KAF2246300.1 hypothetical protein BU26DRAFT_607517 [Trematosphaeria pertusa]
MAYALVILEGCFALPADVECSSASTNNDDGCENQNFDIDWAEQFTHHRHLNEIAIDQAGRLHTNIPPLSLTCNAIFQEMHPRFPQEFVVHVTHNNIRPFFDRRGIFHDIERLSGVKFTEWNTTVVLHGVSKATGRADAPDIRLSNLKWWFTRCWVDGYPAFDAELYYVWNPTPLSPGGTNWGHPDPHPTEHNPAVFQRKCIDLLRYLKMLHETNIELWLEWTLELIQQWNRINDQREIITSAGATGKPMVIDYAETVGLMFDAIIGICNTVYRPHLDLRDRNIISLGNSIHMLLEAAVQAAFGDAFLASKRSQFLSSLPTAGRRRAG